MEYFDRILVAERVQALVKSDGENLRVPRDALVARITRKSRDIRNEVVVQRKRLQ